MIIVPSFATLEVEGWLFFVELEELEDLGVATGAVPFAALTRVST